MGGVQANPSDKISVMFMTVYIASFDEWKGILKDKPIIMSRCEYVAPCYITIDLKGDVRNIRMGCVNSFISFEEWRLLKDMETK